MTDEELAAIRERAEQATPGPWHADYTDIIAEDDSLLFEGDIGTHTAEFVAHARTDIPALLAEVERLRAEDARQSEWIAALMDEQPRYATANARLTTENAAMREIVQEVATEDTCAYEGDAGDEVRCVLCAGEEADWRTAPEESAAWANWRWQQYRHAPDCPVTKARALLASETNA